MGEAYPNCHQDQREGEVHNYSDELIVLFNVSTFSLRSMVVTPYSAKGEPPLQLPNIHGTPPTSKRSDESTRKSSSAGHIKKKETIASSTADGSAPSRKEPPAAASADDLGLSGEPLVTKVSSSQWVNVLYPKLSAGLFDDSFAPQRKTAA